MGAVWAVSLALLPRLRLVDFHKDRETSLSVLDSVVQLCTWPKRGRELWFKVCVFRESISRRSGMFGSTHVCVYANFSALIVAQ